MTERQGTRSSTGNVPTATANEIYCVPAFPIAAFGAIDNSEGIALNRVVSYRGHLTYTKVARERHMTPKTGGFYMVGWS